MRTSRPETAGFVQAGAGHGHRIGGFAEDGHAGLLTEDPQLLDGRRALEVGPDQHGVATLLAEPAGQLGRRRRLTRPLEAGQEDHRRGGRGVGEAQGLAAEDADQLLVDGLDDLLAGAQALGYVLTDQPEPDAVDEGPGHPDIDVGFEQGGADLAQGLVDIVVTQPSAASEAPEDAFEPVGQGVEHAVAQVTGARRAPRSSPGRLSRRGRRRSGRHRRRSGRPDPHRCPPV